MSQLIYGLHAVEAALKNTQITIQELYIAETKQAQKLAWLYELAQLRKIKIKTVSKKELDQLLGDVIHQGVAARALYQEKHFDEADLLRWIEKATEPLLFLVLDGIQDPHNLGACLRTAEAAGVKAVIAPKDKSVSLTPTVRKVACGAAEIVPFIQVTNLARCLKQIKQAGVWCYGLAGEATKTLYQTKLDGHIALILGSEGDGLRQLTRECCDDLLSIPMAGTVSSVNVSVATGISLFEAVRQRG